MKNNVVEICQPPRTFTLKEVDELIPTLQRISEKHENAIAAAMQKQRYFMISGAPQALVTEQDTIVGQNMADWGKKLYKLGAKILPGGYIGFDSGCFYWSWHWGEESCEYYHEYKDNPQVDWCRRKLEKTKPENVV